MEIIMPMTTAQVSDHKGIFWGREIQDIMMGDRFIFGGREFELLNVETTNYGARISVADASKNIHGNISFAAQFFNQDAEIEWII